jgi:hypothetical protein
MNPCDYSKKSGALFPRDLTRRITCCLLPCSDGQAARTRLTRCKNPARGRFAFQRSQQNGTLDKYEDWRLSLDVCVNDLVAQMTLEEKAGLMVGPSLTIGPNGGISVQPTYGVNPFNPGLPAIVSPATEDGILKRHIRQFINRDNLAPKTMANWLNAVQQVAEGSRLGVPVLFVTNPRNTFGQGAIFGIAEASGTFSAWPGTLGLAAMRDPALIEEFARIAAQEYVSVGLRGAYHPTADIGTEPRLAAKNDAGYLAGYLGQNTGAPLTLTLPAEQVAQLQALMKKKPTVVVLFLERPLVVPESANESAALLAPFGVSDEALFDVLMGKFNPTGRLPFEMPSSREAVRMQLEDVPYDSKAPLFKFGFGLGYPTGQ